MTARTLLIYHIEGNRTIKKIQKLEFLHFIRFLQNGFGKKVILHLYRASGML